MIGYDPQKRAALQAEYSLTDSEYARLERMGKSPGELTLDQMAYVARALAAHKDMPQGAVILTAHLAIIKTPEQNALPPDPVAWVMREFYQGQE